MKNTRQVSIDRTQKTRWLQVLDFGSTQINAATENQLAQTPPSAFVVLP